jgi:hypothetical protein
VHDAVLDVRDRRRRDDVDRLERRVADAAGDRDVPIAGSGARLGPYATVDVT